MSVADWCTLRELDRAAGAPKGAAFRVFRRLEPGLCEGIDFRQLDPQADGDECRALRQAGRVYPATPRPVLLHPTLAQRIRAELGR